MIAVWMLFALEISALLFIAAWLAERALTAGKRPVRWVWILAMVGTIALPIAAWFAPGQNIDAIAAANAPHRNAATTKLVNAATTKLVNAAATEPVNAASTDALNGAQYAPVNAASKAALVVASAAATGVNANNSNMGASSSLPVPSLYTAIKTLGRMVPGSISRFEVAANSPLQRFNSPLLILWTALISTGALVCLFAVLRTWRQRGHWSSEYVDGAPVLVTHDVGPALVGVLQYSIVVPRWVFSLEEHARKLILTHEREHARAYDPLLLAGGVLLVLFAPWNVVNWAMLRRLRLGIELDCDQRVLRSHPDARGYSTLLLDVAERTLPSVLPQAALVEHGTSLEHRIRHMISPAVRHRALRVGANAIAVAALITVACVTPRPYASLPPAERVAQLRSDLADAMVSERRALTHDDSVMLFATPMMPGSKTKTWELVRAPMRSDSASLRARSEVPDSMLMKRRATRDTAFARAMSQYTHGRDPDIVSARIREYDANATQANVRSHTGQEKIVRDLVASAVSQTLERWPRQDSVLFVILNADGTLARHFASPVPPVEQHIATDQLLGLQYFPNAIEKFDATGAISITSRANGQQLDVPLRVIWARLSPHVTAPRRRQEIIPTHEQMVATLHRTHVEIFADTGQNSLIGTLLYTTEGELLATNAVRATEPRKLPDGQVNPDYQRNVIRTAFGKLIDLVDIQAIGYYTYFDEQTPPDGRPRVMYVVIAKTTPVPNFGSGIELNNGKFNVTAAIKYRGPQPLLDQKAVDNRLKSAVSERAPQAFTNWSRTDSAVYIIFDVDDRLLISSAGPIAQNGELNYLIGLLKSRMPLLPALDFTVVGFSTLRQDAIGKALANPLQIVWGRLKRGAMMPVQPALSGFTPKGMSAGSSSRSADPNVMLEHMEKRLRGAVLRDKPKAFGNAWSRADSAVVILYDANEQIVFQSAGPLAQDAQLLPLASYFNKRFTRIKADDVETVGIVNFVADANARPLNVPLQVVWGRLKEGASFSKKK